MAHTSCNGDALLASAKCVALLHHWRGTVPCNEVLPAKMSTADRKNERSAGRVPVRPLLPETSRIVKYCIALGSSQAGGKAGPVNMLSFSKTDLT